MNYRHIYHAGNFADVFKHLLLLMLIEAFKRKEKGFACIDTHAGAGLYDLASEEADKTGEWQGGIGRLLQRTDPPSPVARYAQIVRACQLAGEPGSRNYPGSPYLARQLLRPQDRLALCELHPDAYGELHNLFAGDRQVGVHHLDGFTGMKALLPPPERRGLVLIDPPYEQEREIAAIMAGLREAQSRWPTGTYAIWYPVSERAGTPGLLRQLKASGIRRILNIEFAVGETAATAMTGNGMVVIRPPWQFDTEVEQLLPWLVDALAPQTGTSRCEWLVGE